MITKAEIEQYREGACDALALAICELTGWPVYVLIEDGEPVHAFALSPSEQAVDIEGVHSLDELCGAWQLPDYREVRDDEISGGQVDSAVRARARELAAELVSHIQK